MSSLAHRPEEPGQDTKISSSDPVLSTIPIRKRRKAHGSSNDDTKTRRLTRNNWHLDLLKGEKLAGEGKEYIIPKIKVVDERIFVTKGSRTFNVKVKRNVDIIEHRQKLPVCMEEQEIMEAINDNDVVIICAETGSGKSTQIPQFLYEAGYGDSRNTRFPGKIVVTEPRRIAAISTAQRVAYELGQRDNNSIVGYQVRYHSSNISSNTVIKFVTEGILLKELTGSATGNMIQNNIISTGVSSICVESDPLLSHYSCIIIDEAHEMSVSTDVLLGWLARISQFRSKAKLKNVTPLKLVIMSATLNVDVFLKNNSLLRNMCRYKVIKVEGRQHKVIIHYNKYTPNSYVDEAYTKVLKIHKRLPPGNILVFLSGRSEVESLCSRLRKIEIPQNEIQGKTEELCSSDEEENAVSHLFLSPEDTVCNSIDVVERSNFSEPSRNNQEKCTRESLPDNPDIETPESSDEEENLSYIPEININATSDNPERDQSCQTFSLLHESSSVPIRLQVLPLYSTLSNEAQKKVFEDTPSGVRTVIVATNIAETSITIPNIKYVVDSGKVKQRCYNPNTMSYTFKVEWTSKASANQRSGRAGRIGVGHCYRLFSSAVFANQFKDFTDSEILRVPLEDLCINMKAMGVNDISKFPFFTAPSTESIIAAEEILINIGCLSSDDKRITALGMIASKLPIHPRYSKILIAAASHDTQTLARAISMVSTASSGEIFTPQVTCNSQLEKSKIQDYKIKMTMLEGNYPISDFLKMQRAFGAYTVEAHRSRSSGIEFCKNFYLNHKEVEEALKLHNQLCHLVYLHLPHDKFPSAMKILSYTYPNIVGLLKPPSFEDESVLRICVLSGFTDRIARLEELESSEFTTRRYVYRIREKKIGEKEDLCILDSSSCLRKHNTPPEWICYGSMLSKSKHSETEHQTFFLSLATVIEPEWINLVIGPNRYKIIHFLETPRPYYDMADDCIKAMAQTVLLPQNWLLPPRECIYSKVSLSSAWFARNLVEGKVAANVNKIESIFCIMAPHVRKSSTVIVSRVNVNISDPIHSLTSNALSLLFIKNKINSVKTLNDIKKQNPYFSLTEYLEFISEHYHDLVKKTWYKSEFSASELYHFDQQVCNITKSING